MLQHLGHHHIDIPEKSVGVDEPQTGETRLLATPGEIYNLGDGFG